MSAVKFPLLELLPEAQRSKELGNLKMHRLHAGQTLYEAGDVTGANFIFVGKIRIGSDMPDGTGMFFSHHGPGSMLGWYSMLTGIPQPFSAVAIEDSHVGKMPADYWLELVLGNRACAEYMLRYVTGRLVKETERFLQVSLLEARRRIAADLVERSKTAAGETFNVPERIEWASRLRMTRETLSRHLSEFQKKRIIEISQQRIRVLDGKQLAEMIG